MKSKNRFLNILLILLFSLFLFSCDKENKNGKITLDKSQMQLFAGSSSDGMLTATLENLNGTITWESSDPNVAYVEQDSVEKTVARVKPGIKGNATITVKVSNKSASCEVLVVEPDYIKTDEKIVLQVGTTHQVTYETNIVPNNPTYQSNNTEVVTINASGLISARENGTATITLKVGTITKYINVAVEDPGISLSIEENIVLSSVDLEQITLTAIPKGGLDIEDGIWTVDDDTVVSITQVGLSVVISALQTGAKRSTIVRFVFGDYEVTKEIYVKDIDIELSFSSTLVTLVFNQSQIKLTPRFNPIQTGDDAKVTWSYDVEGIITIADNGMITRVEDYDFGSNEQVSVNITATALIDPNAKATLLLIVESPNKYNKVITTKEQFISVFTNSQNSAANIEIMANIDLEEHQFGVAMGGTFTGTINGNGYTVSNFKATSLFSVFKGKIENLGLQGTSLAANNGLLSFYVESPAIINNCYFDVTFGANESAGLGRNNAGGQISNCIIVARNTSGFALAYAGFVQAGTALTNCYYQAEGNIFPGSASLFNASVDLSSFDESIWNISPGVLPTLKNSN